MTYHLNYLKYLSKNSTDEENTIISTKAYDKGSSDLDSNEDKEGRVKSSDNILNSQFPSILSTVSSEERIRYHSPTQSNDEMKLNHHNTSQVKSEPSKMITVVQNTPLSIHGDSDGDLEFLDSLITASKRKKDSTTPNGPTKMHHTSTVIELETDDIDAELDALLEL